MSRIGKRPVPVPNGVTVTLTGQEVQVKGGKGQLSYTLPTNVTGEVADGEVRLLANYREDKAARMSLGTARAVVNNLVVGCAEGFVRKLQLVGVGYRASVQGTTMELNLGYSKPVVFPLPVEVKAEVENNTLITLSSHDKVQLGQTAAKIRSLRSPEPFQGKGIHYEGERIRRKAGKSGKK